MNHLRCPVGGHTVAEASLGPSLLSACVDTHLLYVVAVQRPVQQTQTQLDILNCNFNKQSTNIGYSHNNRATVYR